MRNLWNRFLNLFRKNKKLTFKVKDEITMGEWLDLLEILKIQESELYENADEAFKKVEDINYKQDGPRVLKIILKNPNDVNLNRLTIDGARELMGVLLGNFFYVRLKRYAEQVKLGKRHGNFQGLLAGKHGNHLRKCALELVFRDLTQVNI